MTEINANDIVLTTLSKPFDLWEGYLKKVQKGSDYDPKDFKLLIANAVEVFHKDIHVNDWRHLAPVENLTKSYFTSVGWIEVNDNRLLMLMKMVNRIWPSELQPLLEEPKDDIMEHIEKHLSFLTGKFNGKQIMVDDDYKFLIKKLRILIDSSQCPSIEREIPHYGISNEFLSYTISLLHDEVLNHHRGPQYQWIKFIHSIFVKFQGDEAHTKRKFRSKPLSYNQDKASIK
jgi:hypothetical protein